MHVNKEANQKIVAIINKCIPYNIKLVPYLMDNLQLSKESVYRRIKGDVPFTFDEVLLLSSELEFSLDDIKSSHKRSFITLPENNGFNPADSFLFTLQDYYNFIKNQFNATESASIIVFNRILPVYVTGFELLFKFTYFKWLHQTKSLPSGYCFSELVLPHEINDLRKKINYYAKLRKNITSLIDKNIFLSLLKEIQYFYKRKLISEGDLILLKNDLTGLCKEMEEISFRGNIVPDNKYLIYLSTFDVASNIVYATLDEKTVVSLWTSPVYPVNISNPDTCEWYKSLIDSLMEYSSLISKSNDLLRIDFFEKQYECIEKL